MSRDTTHERRNASTDAVIVRVRFVSGQVAMCSPGVRDIRSVLTGEWAGAPSPETAARPARSASAHTFTEGPREHRGRRSCRSESAYFHSADLVHTYPRPRLSFP